MWGQKEEAPVSVTGSFALSFPEHQMNREEKKCKKKKTKKTQQKPQS